MRLRPPQLGRLGQRTLSPRRLSSGPAAALPASVDAVVIGGGCVGASACYHLQEQGLSTLLLEAHSLTAGTTWHTAGMLWRLRPSYVDIELHTHTRELAMRLEEAPGAAWTQNGGLFIAGNKERLAEYERLGQTGEYYGIASEVLSPSEEYASPTGTVGRRVVGVHTSCGQTIRTGHVVNACGAWAGAVSEMAGAPLPLLAMKHAYVEPLEGMHGGLPNVRDHDLSVYLKAQGSAMAIGGLFDLDWDTFLQNMTGHVQRCPAVEHTGIASTVCGPESFTPDHKPLVGPQPGGGGFNSMGMMLSGGIGRELAAWVLHGAPTLDLFGFDPARFHASTVADARWVQDRTHESYAKTYAIVFPSDEPLAGRGARRSALHDCLAAAGCVFQARHGFERPGWFVGPDVGAGALPRSYDYYGAYADEESGWRLGAGRADVAAHESHPYLDFVEGELTFGWPASFGRVRAARSGVALFDQSYFGKLLISGPRADAAMQWVCGNDMEGRAPGAVVYTPLCNARGGVEADVTVTRLADNRWYMCTGGATASHDLRWIESALDEGGFGGGVSVADISDELTLLSVQGPLSHQLLAPLVGGGAIDDLSAFPFSTAREGLTVAGVPDVRLLRLTFVGELGFELHMPAGGAPQVYAALREAGAALERRSGAPVRDAGYFAIDSLSAEKSYRHWHADLACGDSPQEAAIGFTVLPKLRREDAPGFLGRDALLAKMQSGLQRRIVTLTLDADGGPGGAPPLHGAELIERDGEPLGIVRSTAYGHSIGKQVVTGYVRCPDGLEKITPKWLREGSWAVRSKRRAPLPATLHLKAPFDPEGKRIAGDYSEAEDLLEVAQ
ncbi:sarcosine dehydrogenase [Emiliania huxleyi CCMP1516]|uniref:Dimethylglycine dehydrogenase n=2 Tax=Emiliania huxleyi TaxID=2903 RepID=A0A0D3KUN5_EMIH1|nr:sarcosine dehydrogenase [Emiliania huxleyi CCMP1516]EOD39470.1 sarcosine dehydrogenase [Emiliania huxleyi CCMP1516]|eukprot:XP_005791899.1 sarcosine dehydrogenase [Emiliania huxleyi CCMP1516]